MTSNTLSMAVLSLVRFLLIRHPVSRENNNFYRKVRHLLLLAIWSVSITTSIPILFVRQEESFTVGSHVFTFCLESWSTEIVKRVYAGITVTTVYIIPSAVLLFCHLKVAFLIRTYERASAASPSDVRAGEGPLSMAPHHPHGPHTTDRLASRRSFNRRGFKVKEDLERESPLLTNYDSNYNGGREKRECGRMAGRDYHSVTLPVCHTQQTRVGGMVGIGGRKKSLTSCSGCCSCSNQVCSCEGICSCSCDSCQYERDAPSDTTKTTPTSIRQSRGFPDVSPNCHITSNPPLEPQAFAQYDHQTIRSRRLNQKR